MEFVTVRGQLTLEQRLVSLILNEPLIERMSRVIPRQDEVKHYDELSDDVRYAVEQADESTSRQIVVAHSPPKGTKLWCFTSIQLLLGRKVNSMLVTMRSSSTRRLASDLGFVSRIAQRYDCSEIRVSIGSFHVELTDFD